MKVILISLTLFSTICNAGYFWPEQIRIAWTENENEMRVSWVTYWNMNTYVKYRPILCPDATEDGSFTYLHGSVKAWN